MMRRSRSIPRGTRFRLWFGLLGGAFAWTIHLMTAYVVAEFGCVRGWADQGTLGISWVAWTELALTTATAATAAWATIVALQTFRGLPPMNKQHEAAISAERSTAWAGIVTSGLFVFIILFESIPILFYLQSC